MIRGKLVDPVVKALVNNNAIDKFEYNVMPFKRLMAYYKCAIMEVETKFKVLNQEFSLEYDRNPIETIKTRLKSPDSIVKKLAKKDVPLTVESIEKNLNDIAGDIKLIEVKDYIKNPKPNGYRSLHLIVEIPIFLKDEKKNMRVEVQLRTIAMDFWASLEHKLSYKKDIPQDEEELLRRELLDCAQISADLDLRMEKIKNRIVNKEN